MSFYEFFSVFYVKIYVFLPSNLCIAFIFNFLITLLLLFVFSMFHLHGCAYFLVFHFSIFIPVFFFHMFIYIFFYFFIYLLIFLFIYLFIHFFIHSFIFTFF